MACGKSALHTLFNQALKLFMFIRKHDIKMLELTPEQASIARGLRALLEDNLYFVLVAENCIHGDLKGMLAMYPRYIPAKAPNFLQSMILMKIKWSLGSQVSML